MAKYKSILTIQGTIDDLTFRQTKEGKIVGKKTGPTREQVLQHEQFRLTRHNANEFKQAIRDARLLRHGLGHVLDGLKCTTLNGHVNGLLHRLSRQDTTHEYGGRCAIGGDVGQMTGFEFNKDLPLSTAFKAGIEHLLDAGEGDMQVRISPFIAYKKKAFPKAATHFRLVHGGVAINFSTKKYRPQIAFSDLLPLSRKTPGSIGFDCSLPVESGELLVQVLGIQLFRLEKGEEVLVKGGAVQILDAAKAVTRIEDELPVTRIESESHETRIKSESHETRIKSELHETRIKSELHELTSVEVIGADQECSMLNDQCSIPNKGNMTKKHNLSKDVFPAHAAFPLYDEDDYNDGHDLIEALLPELVLCE